MTTEDRHVAFVGLGEMGLPMARRLLTSGYQVAGFDVRPGRVSELARAGGRASSSAGDVATGAGVTIVIPFDGPQVREVLLGPNGVLDSLQPGGLVVQMATIGPRAMRELGEEVVARGFQIVDAPVTGGVAKAEDGTLTVIASGNSAALDRAAPLLAPMSAVVYRVGAEPGAAQFVKLINQLLVGIHLTATAEAMAMGAAAGVDPGQLYEVLTHAMGRSEVLTQRVPTVLDGTLRTGGNLQIYLKDLPLALDAGRELGVPLPVGAAAFQMVQLARALGLGDRDDAHLIAMLMDPSATIRAASEPSSQ